MTNCIVVLLTNLVYWLLFNYWIIGYAGKDFWIYQMLLSVVPFVIFLIAFVPAAMKKSLLPVGSPFPFAIAVKAQIILGILWILAFGTWHINLQRRAIEHQREVNDCSESNKEMINWALPDSTQIIGKRALDCFDASMKAKAKANSDQGIFFCINQMQTFSCDTTFHAFKMTHSVIFLYTYGFGHGRNVFKCLCNDSVCIETEPLGDDVKTIEGVAPAVLDTIMNGFR